MKKLLIPIILLFSLLHHSSCDQESISIDKPQSQECDQLEEALIFGDEALLKMSVNELCQKYPPLPVSGDDIGHQKNLDSIIEELNTQCSGFVTEFGCYACLESNPPLSVITFKLDSAGVIITRGITLITPEGNFMTYW